MTPASERTWTEGPSGVWCSADGKYAIVRVILPEEPVTATSEIYLLRGAVTHTSRVSSRDLGYHIGQHYSLEEAQQWAHIDARAKAAASANDETLDGLPVVTKERFWWPVSDGITRGALTLTSEDGHLYARIVGMNCRTETEWEPGTYAEIDITAAPAAAATHPVRRAFRWVRRAMRTVKV